MTLHGQSFFDMLLCADALNIFSSPLSFAMGGETRLPPSLCGAWGCVAETQPDRRMRGPTMLGVLHVHRAGWSLQWEGEQQLPIDKCVLPLHLHGVQNHQTTFLCTLCFEFQQLESLKRKQLAALSRNGRHPLPDISMLVPCILDYTCCCSSCI